MKRVIKSIILLLLCMLTTSCSKSQETIPVTNNTYDSYEQDDTAYTNPSLNVLTSNDDKQVVVEEERNTEEVIEYEEDKGPQLLGTYKFSIASCFSNGRAWVGFNYDQEHNTWDENYTQWYAVIDEDFRIIYKTSEVGFIDELSEFGNDGFSYFRTNDGNYVIIDKFGNECYRTRNTEDCTCSICGHGENVFLLRKHISNFSTDAWYLSQINPYGEEISPEKELSFFGNNFKYIGAGIFKSYSGINRVEGGFYNSNTNELWEHNNGEFLSPFVDGKAFYAFRWYQVLSVTPEIFESEETLSEWENATGKEYGFYDTCDDRFLPILPYEDPIKVSGIGYGSDGYFPVQLEGADGNNYFTIVNQDGVQQFEPIKYPGLKDFSGSDLSEKLDSRFKNGNFVYDNNVKDDNGNSYIEWNIIKLDGSTNTIRNDDGFNGFFAFDGKLLYLDNSYNKDSLGCTIINVISGEVQNEIYLYDYLESLNSNTSNELVQENQNIKEYNIIRNYSIYGKWKNIGEGTYGQAQKGAIIVFDGNNCNFFSPSDTYAFYEDGDWYRLDCTSPFADTVTFTVKTIDDNHIDIIYNNGIVELERVE